MAWSTSNRRSRLPANWNTIRAQRLAMDGYRCQWIENGVQCTERATDVDHKKAMTDSSDLQDLQSLCRRHHSRKSSREGGKAAQARKRALKSEHRRLPESHPGYQYVGQPNPFPWMISTDPRSKNG